MLNTVQKVVNWEVFTINICCFIANILFLISTFTLSVYYKKLGNSYDNTELKT